MAVTYGYDAAPVEDPFVTKVERLISLFLEVLTPERAALIGAIPLREFFLDAHYFSHFIPPSTIYPVVASGRDVQMPSWRVPWSRS